jgi:hypothetical protein
LFKSPFLQASKSSLPGSFWEGEFCSSIDRRAAAILIFKLSAERDSRFFTNPITLYACNVYCACSSKHGSVRRTRMLYYDSVLFALAKTIFFVPVWTCWRNNEKKWCFAIIL